MVNNIYIFLLILILATSYTLYYVFNKILLKHFSIKEIIVHAYLWSAIIVLYNFKNDFISGFKKFNINYFLFIILACANIIGNILLTFVCTKDLNFGLIEGVAMGIYIPFVTIISYYFYNNKITFENFIGLILISLGVVFASK